MSNEINDRWWLLDYLFSRFEWYRRRCGGHWELWWNDVTYSAMWYNRRKCYRDTNNPPCGRGVPRCEDYPA